MAREIINTGELPNDGSGDPIRLAFDKINNNFANLFTLTGANTQSIELIDPLRVSFDTINNNFANLFAITEANNQVVELVTPITSNAEPYITNTSSNNNTINTINISNVYINNTFDSSTGVSIVPKKTASINPPTIQFTAGPYGYQEYINIGASPNDGNGDPLRTAFSKINNNFSNLFLTTTTTSTAYTSGNTANQVIFQVPVVEFYQGEFQIRSSDSGTPDMQNITLTASITNNLDGVRFSGHSTLFRGNAICRYNMDVSAGNVRILINPLADIGIEHFIAAYITYPDQVVIPGIEIALNGYANGYLLGTENNLILTTESQ